MHIVRYFHVSCAFTSFQRAKISSSVISDTSQLDGVQELHDQEKALIVQYSDNGNKTRSKPLTEKCAKRDKSQMQIPAQIRQTRLAPSSLPSINVMFTNADQLTSGENEDVITRNEREKPLNVAVCEMKPKNSKERKMLDYTISDYSIHPSKS